MLLLNERPIMFSRTLAKILNSVNEATVLQQVNFWIEINKKKGKEVAFKEGYYWTRRSIREWQKEDFDYMSIATVTRTFDKLVKKGLLITGEFNDFRADRTKWYRINKKKLEELHKNILKDKNEDHLSKTINANNQNDKMHLSKMNNSHLVKMSEPIEENKKRLNKEINISSHSNNNIIYSTPKKENERRSEDENNKVRKVIYNTEYFRNSFGYSRVSKNKQNELDTWIKYAVDICLMPPDTKLKVGKVSTNAKDFQERLLKLKYEHITYIFERLKGVSYPGNHQNYMLAVLYNAYDQYESSMSTFKGGKDSNTGYAQNGKYHAPMPDYMQERMENLSNKNVPKKRVTTKEEEEAFNNMLRELKS